MYKHKNKISLERSKQLLLWLKRKILLIITAFMLGMANGMNAEEQSGGGAFVPTEQQDKKD